MVKWWVDVWSLGEGATRLSCGVARTPEGFAVDLFEGDTCIESEVYPTRAEARQAAENLRGRYQRHQRRASFVMPSPGPLRGRLAAAGAESRGRL
jgi:hypothetical protein